jgi:hypothetical protein
MYNFLTLTHFQQKTVNFKSQIGLCQTDARCEICNKANVDLKKIKTKL